MELSPVQRLCRLCCEIAYRTIPDVRGVCVVIVRTSTLEAEVAGNAHAEEMALSLHNFARELKKKARAATLIRAV